MSSFGPGSAGGLLGYKPYLLQQGIRTESRFSEALTVAVNHLASGKAPRFLKRFLAGGVSIALQKDATAIRPLACGDPLRRLVGKCFCVVAREEISQSFQGKNFGVGCRGGVEVVAHSLRDVLSKHTDSNLALLKIDFKNAFNLIKREHFVPAVCQDVPKADELDRVGVMASLRCCFTTTAESSSRVAEYNKATLWALSTSAAVSTGW